MRACACVWVGVYLRITIGKKNAAAETVDQKLVFTGNELGKVLALRNHIKVCVCVCLCVLSLSLVLALDLTQLALRVFVYSPVCVCGCVCVY